MARSIYVLDPLSSRSTHVNFNATIIESLSRLHGVGRITVQTRRSYLPQLEGVMRTRPLESDIEYVTVGGVQPGGRFRLALELGVSVIRFARHARRERPSAVVVLATDNTIFPLGLLIWALGRRDRPTVFAFLHNNLQQLHLRALPRLVWRTLLKLEAVTPLALTRQQAAAAAALFGGRPPAFLPHPCYGHLADRRKSRERGKDTETVFLLLGRQAQRSIRSGLLDTLVRAGEQLAAEVGARIRVLVATSDVTQLPKSTTIEVTALQTPVPAERYWALITEASFLVLDNSGDELRPSGLLVDGLTAGTPLIVHQGGHADDFPELGAVSYDSMDAFSLGVRQAVAADDQEYRDLVALNLDLAEELGLQRTSVRLGELLDPHLRDSSAGLVATDAAWDAGAAR